MFDALQNQQNQTDQQHKFINQFECNHDRNPRNISVHHGYTQHPQHPIQSMYVPNKEFFPENRRSVRSLKDELEKVKDQVEKMKKKDPEEDEGLNKMIKKLLE